MHDVLEIDNNLRITKIPPGMILGVENDIEVRRLHFKMPKNYGEFDLSTFEIRINYANARNKGDFYVVDDSVVEGDTITFSWLVGRNATLSRGRTRFVVCMRKVDESGVVQQEFNTAVASLYVLEGLETTGTIAQQNPDAIEAILKRLDNVEKNGSDSGTGSATTSEPIILDGNSDLIVWNVQEGENAIVTTYDKKGIAIQHAQPGQMLLLQCYGNDIDWVASGSEFRIGENMLYTFADTAHHWIYTLFFDGQYFDVSGQPVMGGVYEQDAESASMA